MGTFSEIFILLSILLKIADLRNLKIYDRKL